MSVSVDMGVRSCLYQLIWVSGVFCIIWPKWNSFKDIADLNSILCVTYQSLQLSECIEDIFYSRVDQILTDTKKWVLFVTGSSFCTFFC